MIKNSKLFIRLIKLEEVEFDDSYPLSSMIQNKLIPFATDYLERIIQFLPEYTIHNIKHSFRILENIENILPTSLELNIIEINILLYSIILHDIGMVSDIKERKKILISDDFELFKSKSILTDEEQIFGEFIRVNHVKRSVKLIDKISILNPEISFEYKNLDLKKYIKAVIENHGLSIEKLANTEKFPRREILDDKVVNIQFLSILLRLGDLLEIDISRTPLYIFKFLTFQSDVSKFKWEKSQSFKGKILTSKSIQFNFECNNPKIERDVNKYVKFLENQRYKCVKLLDKYEDSKYKLELQSQVEANIKNDNSYIYTEEHIKLDYDHIINILMGTELYDSADVFLRELIQNSYDACRMAIELHDKYNDDFSPKYEPKIIIEYDKNSKTLTIEDNGVGIDNNIAKKYLTNIGNSYYKSNDFKSHNFKFKPISNFGIGILSCFMVSNSINIESKKFNTKEPINITLFLDDKYVLKKSSSYSRLHGTRVSLSLKDAYAYQLEQTKISNILLKNILTLEIPITVKENETPYVFFNEKINFDDNEHLNRVGVEPLLLKIENEFFSGIFSIIEGNEEILAQNGFIIKTTERRKNKLLPNWFRRGYSKCNIKGDNTLTLKASRNEFNKNENFKKVCTNINNCIVDTIKELSKESKNIPTLFKYFNFGYDYELYDSFDFDKYKEELDFFDECLFFEKLDKEKELFINFNNIKENKFNSIIIVDSDNFKYKIIDNDFNLEVDADLIITDKYFATYFNFIIKDYIEKIEVIVSDKEGFVYRRLILNWNNKSNYINSKFVDSIKDKKNNEFTFIIENFEDKDVHEYDKFIEIVFNKNSLIGNHLNFINDIYDDEFIHDLTNDLVKILTKEMLKNKKFDNLKEDDLYLGRSNMTILPPFCIGIITPDVINRINDKIQEYLIIYDIEDLIDYTNLCNNEEYIVNKNDFPRWWLDDSLKEEI